MIMYNFSLFRFSKFVKKQENHILEKERSIYEKYFLENENVTDNNVQDQD